MVSDPRRKGVDALYNTHLSQEFHWETDKADGFADDNSTATLANFECLEALKKISFDFGKFSGLQCNVDKTTLMQIGSVNQLTEETIGLGFASAEEITILGMLINRDLTSLGTYFDGALQKIKLSIEYWDRFRLTLPGRISVCKTFLLSQIGYIGCIIRPTPVQENNLQKALNDFCLGTLRTAKKKLYTPVSEGGLGLIKIGDFIAALQCSWVKRITQHWGDNWRYDFKRKCYGNPLIADSFTFAERENPILFNIGTSFGKLRKAFTEKDDNYKKALVFKNPFFRRGRDDDRLLCENFFDTRDNFDMNCKIAKLKFEDFFVRNQPKSQNSLLVEFGIDLNLVTYMRLHEALQFAVDSRRNNEQLPTQSLEFFLKSFEKGSRAFRRVLRFKEDSKLKINKLNTVKGTWH
jgi:hypothetical protein